MMEKINPKEQYTIREKKFNKLFKKQKSIVNRISNVRLFTFFAGGGFFLFLYYSDYFTLSILALLAVIALFVYLIFKHQQGKKEQEYYFALHKINQDSLARLKGEWKSFFDTGEEYINDDHHFSEDLDIFGKGSLFQWINTTTTYMGREKLKEVLTKPCESKEQILKRQEAITELSEKLDWRQKFMAEGLATKGARKNPANLYRWGKERQDLLSKPWAVNGLRILPIITVTLIVLAVLIPAIPFFLPLLAIGVQVVLLARQFKERTEILESANSYRDNLKAYRKMIDLIEQEKFESPYLKELKNNLMQKNSANKASQQMHQLEKVADFIATRYSQLYILLNIILLWDYQGLIKLEKWKDKSGRHLKKWFESIGEVEALASLAVIRYDNPTWTQPEITEKSYTLMAEEMGHPLLSNEERVTNNLKIEPPTKGLLITGSNMSGKTTLLRTAGINIILAYVGAPVCAKSFKCSLMRVYSCMRVKDNLEQNISSFYAELLRIKLIITALEKGEKIFFLLDEIFKGTNSRDRHTGARVLIKKLVKEGALGLVSTHDLELGDLARESQEIKNYHFREFYKENELGFDYKLRSGISTTRNAIALMKMAGIEFDEEEQKES